MNEVHLIGGITRDIELKVAASGVKYAQFTLAVDSGFKKVTTNYIDIVAFHEQAEEISQHGKKGTKLSIDGHLSQSQYMDQEGNKHNTLKVILEKFSVVPGNASLAHNDEVAVVEG